MKLFQISSSNKEKSSENWEQNDTDGRTDRQSDRQ
jgi:hypothetical protein